MHWRVVLLTLCVRMVNDEREEEETMMEKCVMGGYEKDLNNSFVSFANYNAKLSLKRKRGELWTN